MNLTRVSRTWARGATVTAMGVAVLIATTDGFAQSYAGLLTWAKQHQVTGWKADSFPLLVDLFVGVGEMGLFLLAIDGHRLVRKKMLTWVDLAIPGLTAVGGWTVSLVFNVGRVKGHHFSDQVTAAVPPVAAMVGLVILLRTLHRYVSGAEQAEASEVGETNDPAPEFGHDGGRSATWPIFWPPFVPDVAEMAETEPSEASEEVMIGHDFSHLADDGHAGHGPIADLDSAIKSASAAGRSRRSIAREFGVTRYQVDKVLDDSADASTGDESATPAINGHPVGHSAGDT